jgi:hypothetical protein
MSRRVLSRFVEVLEDRTTPAVAYALSNDSLIAFDTSNPSASFAPVAITGLAGTDDLVGIDFRPQNGFLYGLGYNSGAGTVQLYNISPRNGVATAIGTTGTFVNPADGVTPVPITGTNFGFDFNPTVDRIRVVSDAAQNLRLHPDTGAAVDADPKADGMQTDGTLAYDAADANAGRAPAIVAAAYTYNPDNDKITTNYAIDARQGVLVTQGSREGAQPAVSPNTGRLFTVGPLGTGAFEHADFDISDVKNVAYAALTPAGGTSVFYRIDLATGAATRIGSVGGKTLVGMAIEP